MRDLRDARNQALDARPGRLAGASAAATVAFATFAQKQHSRAPPWRRDGLLVHDARRRDEGRKPGPDASRPLASHGSGTLQDVHQERRGSAPPRRPCSTFECRVRIESSSVHPVMSGHPPPTGLTAARPRMEADAPRNCFGLSGLRVLTHGSRLSATSSPPRPRGDRSEDPWPEQQAPRRFLAVAGGVRQGPQKRSS
jgi:hypothetical protein